MFTKKGLFLACLLSVLLMFSLINVVYSAINAKAGTSGVNFLKLAVGARPKSLGESYVSIADDANAVYWNPAGLGKLENKEFTVMYNSWLDGITHAYLAYIHPMGDNALGINLIYLDSGKITGRDEDNLPIADFSITDMALTVAYGYGINDSISVGAGIKMVQETIQKSASAIGLDAGILCSLGSLSIGAAIQNLGLTKLKFDQEEETLPMVIRAGVSYKLMDDKLLATTDISLPGDENAVISVGAEYLATDNLPVRIGYKVSPDISATGGLAGVTAGVGFKTSSLQADVIFAPYGNMGTTLGVSLSFKF